MAETETRRAKSIEREAEDAERESRGQRYREAEGGGQGQQWRGRERRGREIFPKERFSRLSKEKVTIRKHQSFFIFSLR